MTNTDAARIAATAYQLAAGDLDKAHALAIDMVMLASAVDTAMEVLEFTAPGKWAQEYAGTITKVAGNAVHYDEGDGEDRRVFVGSNALSRYAGEVAAQNVGKRCLITFGYEPGEGKVEATGKKTDVDLRRLIRVLPLTGAAAETQTQRPAQTSSRNGPAQRPASPAREPAEDTREAATARAGGKVDRRTRYLSALNALPTSDKKEFKAALAELGITNMAKPDDDRLAEAWEAMAPWRQKRAAAA